MRGFEFQPIDWAPASLTTDYAGDRHQTLSFIVPGRPVQKGNVIKGRYGGYHDSTKGLDDWLAVVSAQAKAAMKGYWRNRQVIPASEHVGPLPQFTGAVYVIVTFVLPRPKSTMIDGKRWDLTKPPTPPHTKYPDADKLFRAIGDAMTGIVFSDDAQIVDVCARKRYAYLGETPGALIAITDDVEVL